MSKKSVLKCYNLTYRYLLNKNTNPVTFMASTLFVVKLK